MSVEARQGGGGERTVEVLESVPDDTRREATDGREPTPTEATCPSCDARGQWSLSARHRYSPFGAVLLFVLAVWSAVAGWLLGFGYWPSAVFVLGALYIGLARRSAWICESCGYVKPRKRA